MGRSLAVDVVIGFAQMVVLATGGMNLAVGSIGVCCVMFAGFLMQTLVCRSRRLPARRWLLGGAAGLAQRLRHRPLRRQRLHRHAGEREPLFGRDADPHQGRSRSTACRPSSAAFGSATRSWITRRPRWSSPWSSASRSSSSIATRCPARKSCGGRQRARRRNVGHARRIARSFSPCAFGPAGGVAGSDGRRRASAPPCPRSVARTGCCRPSSDPVLGGTVLAGGFVSVLGTLLGAMLVTIIRSGLLVLRSAISGCSSSSA